MEPFQLNSMECLDNSTLLTQKTSSLTILTMMEVDQVRERERLLQYFIVPIDFCRCLSVLLQPWCCSESFWWRAYHSVTFLCWTVRVTGDTLDDRNFQAFLFGYTPHGDHYVMIYLIATYCFIGLQVPMLVLFSEEGSPMKISW